MYTLQRAVCIPFKSMRDGASARTAIDTIWNPTTYGCTDKIDDFCNSARSPLRPKLACRPALESTYKAGNGLRMCFLSL